MCLLCVVSACSRDGASMSHGYVYASSCSNLSNENSGTESMLLYMCVWFVFLVLEKKNICLFNKICQINGKRCVVNFFSSFCYLTKKVWLFFQSCVSKLVIHLSRCLIIEFWLTKWNSTPQLLPLDKWMVSSSQVLKSVSMALDDPKRAVRQEAVRCRHSWLGSWGFHRRTLCNCFV